MSDTTITIRGNCLYAKAGSQPALQGKKEVHFHLVSDAPGDSSDTVKAADGQPSGNISMLIDPDTPGFEFFEENARYTATFRKVS